MRYDYKPGKRDAFGGLEALYARLVQATKQYGSGSRQYEQARREYYEDRDNYRWTSPREREEEGGAE